MKKTGEHLSIIVAAVLFAVIIGMLLGVFIYNKEKYSHLVISIESMLFTVPSLAIFGILIILLSPVKLGIGKFPAIIALLIYSLLPITRNTYTALKQIDTSIIEQAEGMGFTRNEIILKIMMPLSVPLIMSGIRNSVIVGVGVATISYLIGAGGLGYFIFEGIARTNRSMTLAGTLIISLLGISLNYLLLLFEKIITPRGLREGK